MILKYRQGLYVVGTRVGYGIAAASLTDWRRDLGVFAVERFVEAECLRKRTFEIPADFRIEEVLHGAFGVHVGEPANARHVVVEFSAEKADLVAGRVWHPTQVLENVAGGRIRLTFTCTNLLPVVSRILHWGPHARVIEPKELAATVIDELDRTRSQYATTWSASSPLAPNDPSRYVVGHDRRPSSGIRRRERQTSERAAPPTSRRPFNDCKLTRPTMRQGPAE